MTVRVTQQIVETLVVIPLVSGSNLDLDISTTVAFAVPVDIVSPVEDSVATAIGITETLIDSGQVDVDINTAIAFDMFAGEPNEVNIKTSIGITNKAFDTAADSLTTSVGFTNETADNFVADSLTTTIGIAEEILADLDGDLSANIKTVLQLNNSTQDIQEQALTTSLVLNSVMIDREFFTDTLSIVLTLVAELVEPPLFDTVSIIDTLTVQVEENIDLTTSIGFRLASVADIGSDTCQYAPQIGTTTGEYAAIPAAPVLGHAILTLSYPVGSPTTSVTLRNPQFGNLDTLTYNRINRQSRGGKLIVFADPDWPKSRRLEFTVPTLNQTQVDDLLAFLAISLGLPITLTDWQNRNFDGVITNEPQIIQVGDCASTANFIFEMLP